MNKNKKLNKILLKILKKHPKGISRFNICEILKLDKYDYHNIIYGKYHQIITLHHKRTTIYDHLESLEISGKITRYHFTNGSQGRPSTFWKLNEFYKV